MIGTRLAALALAAAALAPALAQTADTSTGRTPQDEYQRGYATTPMPDQANINAGGAPGTAAINNAADQASQGSSHISAANQAQYDADRASYMDALVRHDHAVDRTDARYRRQQNAYADAMAVWRVQVIECKRGHRAACDLPPPNPADYY